MHPFYEFLGRELPTYGLMMLVAIAVSVIAMYIVAYFKKIKVEINAYLFAGAFAIIGLIGLKAPVHIANVIKNWNDFREVPLSDIMVYIFSEAVFLGGMIGGVIGGLIFCKMFKKKALSLLDLGIVALPVGHAIGRIGCLMAGCCYGIHVDESNPFAIIYPKYPIESMQEYFAPSGIPLLNVPLLEAIFLVILFLVNAVVYLKTNQNGLCTAIYLISYGTWRFIIEGYRGDEVRGYIFMLSTSRWISLFIILAGILILAHINKKNKITEVCDV